jgi:hypothetical protein
VSRSGSSSRCSQFAQVVEQFVGFFLVVHVESSCRSLSSQDWASFLRGVGDELDLIIFLRRRVDVQVIQIVRVIITQVRGGAAAESFRSFSVVQVIVKIRDRPAAAARSSLAVA